jgi:hypothetical protein
MLEHQSSHTGRLEEAESEHVTVGRRAKTSSFVFRSANPKSTRPRRWLGGHVGGRDGRMQRTLYDKKSCLQRWKVLQESRGVDEKLLLTAPLSIFRRD